jgi:hypothetical protein
VTLVKAQRQVEREVIKEDLGLSYRLRRTPTLVGILLERNMERRQTDTESLIQNLRELLGRLERHEIRLERNKFDDTKTATLEYPIAHSKVLPSLDEPKIDSK